MAISTYSELKTAAANWLIRSDLTARIPEFITLAEARLNRILKARLEESDSALTGVVSSRYIPLPAAFAEAKALFITPQGGTVRELAWYEDPATIIVDSSNSAMPRAWTIDGSNVAFDRPCDYAYSFTLRMLSKFALSDASPTNAILTAAPDIYLYATLCEGAPFLRDDELSAAFATKLRSAVNEFNEQESRGSSLQKLATEPGQLTRFHRAGYNIYTDQ